MTALRAYEQRFTPEAAGSDDELIAKAKSGDRDAFGTLFERYRAQALRVAQRKLGNEADAQEAVAHASEKAFAHIGDFDGRAKFSSWLLTIVSNRSIDILRKRGRGEKLGSVVDVGEADEGTGSSLLDRASHDTATPEERVIEQERVRRVQAAIAALPDETDRAIARMLFLEEMSQIDIARQLGIKQPGVSKRMSDIRLHLRTALRDVEEYEEEAAA